MRRSPRAEASAPGASRLTFVRAFAFALLVLGGFSPVAAAPSASDAPRDSVLRGEVVETGCFVIGGRRGEVHKPCALACARAGQDLGVLDEQTKSLFVVVQDLSGGPQPNPLLDHVATRVEVRGTTVERGGVNGIVVRSVKTLTGPAPRR